MINNNYSLNPVDCCCGWAVCPNKDDVFELPNSPPDVPEAGVDAAPKIPPPVPPGVPKPPDVPNPPVVPAVWKLVVHILHQVYRDSHVQ
jgi:hypothetical protein